LNLELVPTNKKIDILVTHTAPTFCYPTGFNNLVYSFAANDPTLLDDLTKERKLLTELFDYLKETDNNITHHYYGHFHSDKVESINDTKHVLIGINNFVDFR
jgi:hypothetical protein